MIDPIGESAAAEFLINMMLVLFAGLALGGMIALVWRGARSMAGRDGY
jgi:hypothetical protein